MAAAIVLAQAGLKVALLEMKETTGGGMRTEELTLPGFKHDLASAIHPFGISSPFFRKLPLEKFGLEWLHADVPLAHPLEYGVVSLERSLAATCAELGADAAMYEALLKPLVQNWQNLMDDFMGPLLRFPKHPLNVHVASGKRLSPESTLAQFEQVEDDHAE